MLSNLISALIGAIAAGLFQTISASFDRRRNSEAALTAIASEVDAICCLIRHQHYLESFETLVEQIDDGTWEGHVWIIDIRSNYFTVYEALAQQLGHLTPLQANRIVNFYAFCKSAIDSTRPDGPTAERFDHDDRVNAIRGTALLLRAILALGGEITAFPKKKLVDPLSREVTAR